MKGPVEDVWAAVHETMYGDEKTAVATVDELTDGIEDLWGFHCALSSMRRAAWLVSTALNSAIIRALKGSAIRMDDAVLRAVEPEPLVKLADSSGLADYLQLSTAARPPLSTPPPSSSTECGPGRASRAMTRPRSSISSLSSSRRRISQLCSRSTAWNMPLTGACTLPTASAWRNQKGELRD